MIPDTFIQDLLARIDIVDLVDSYVPLKKAGANYAACCPFHNEKSPSFTVSPSKQFYHCFGCGAHGTAIGFVMEYQGLGFVDAVKELAGRAGMPVPDSGGGGFHDEKPGQTRTLVEIMARAAQYYKEQLKASPRAIAYCKQRGLSGEIAARFGIGYAPDGWQNLQAVFPDYNADELKLAGLVIENDSGRRYDRFRDRLMIPIINPKGDIIAFGGRIIDLGEPKYLNSPETPLFEKGRELFGLPQARQALRDTNTAIVTEGYMDVIALAQNGVGNAVATLGTATTATHVGKLLRQVDRVVFCFDGDNAGRKAAWRALENSLEALADNKRLGFVFLPPEHDPDSYIRAQGKAEFDRQVIQATPLSDFLLRELAQRCDLTSSEGKAQLIYEAKPLLLKLPTPLLRLQLVKRLAEASGFAQSEVERLCELKSFVPAPPPKVKRSAPSLTRNLLRIVLHKPQLAAQLPPELLPDTPERPALLRLHQLVAGQREAGSYAVLREQLRGLPEETMIENAAAELLGQAFDETEAETEFRDTVDKLRAAEQKRLFAELQLKAQQFGVAGLSAAEKQAYIQLLGTQPNRS
ncbi:DNA primase [Azonexus sp.]|jgi:DNA primase|uniref:DNA primase n=1 Tax=Azonexus sp. TaxID=1872668 RepID=UPI00282AB58B|nr:DNA primase [Azonexus sp.]MDR1996079.1 DNA primase [Azonexus sp.]